MIGSQASADAMTLWLIFYNRLTRPNFDQQPGQFQNSLSADLIREVTHPTLQKPPFRFQLGKVQRLLVSRAGFLYPAQTAE